MLKLKVLKNIFVNRKEWPDKPPSKTLTKTCLNDHS